MTQLLEVAVYNGLLITALTLLFCLIPMIITLVWKMIKHLIEE